MRSTLVPEISADSRKRRAKVLPLSSAGEQEGVGFVEYRVGRDELPPIPPCPIEDLARLVVDLVLD
jgi:hypothetical protein